MHRHVGGGYNGIPTSLGIVRTLIHCLGRGPVADKPCTSRYPSVSVADITDCATSPASDCFVLLTIFCFLFIYFIYFSFMTFFCLDRDDLIVSGSSQKGSDPDAIKKVRIRTWSRCSLIFYVLPTRQGLDNVRDAASSGLLHAGRPGASCQAAPPSRRSVQVKTLHHHSRIRIRIRKGLPDQNPHGKMLIRIQAVLECLEKIQIQVPVSVSNSDPDGSGFFRRSRFGFKSPDPDPSINKLMGSKWWLW